MACMVFHRVAHPASASTPPLRRFSTSLTILSIGRHPEVFCHHRVGWDHDAQRVDGVTGEFPLCGGAGRGHVLTLTVLVARRRWEQGTCHGCCSQDTSQPTGDEAQRIKLGACGCASCGHVPSFACFERCQLVEQILKLSPATLWPPIFGTLDWELEREL